MAEQVSSTAPGTADAIAGAPIAKDAIDPDLVKLRRPRPKVGMVTAAGIVVLCIVFWFRLGPDRRFGSSPATPREVAIGDVLAGKIDPEQLLSLTAEPLMAHAVRASTTKGITGVRVVPARGTGDRLWLVLPGETLSPVSEPPIYRGRLRRLRDTPFAADIGEYLTRHPRPVFAPPSAVRAALAGGKLRTVTGDELIPHDRDEVALDVLDLETCTVVASFNERLPDAAAWSNALVAARLLTAATPPQQTSTDVARYSLEIPAAAASALLEQAGLWAARVEPVLRTYRGTWAELRASPAGTLTIGSASVPDSQIDLVGVFVARDLPAEAYALITGEAPADYWYVRPISISLLVVGALFLWILVRAVRRDLWSPPTA